MMYDCSGTVYQSGLYIKHRKKKKESRRNAIWTKNEKGKFKKKKKVQKRAEDIAVTDLLRGFCVFHIVP